MARRFDHIDLRAPSLADVASFYRALLPALGFTEEGAIPGWLQFCFRGEGATQFFGVTADPQHIPNQNRIAFWSENIAEVDRIGHLLADIGARNVEGPELYEPPGYYAVFFEDPVGNRLELCHRTEN